MTATEAAKKEKNIKKEYAALYAAIGNKNASTYMPSIEQTTRRINRFRLARVYVVSASAMANSVTNMNLYQNSAEEKSSISSLHGSLIPGKIHHEFSLA